MTKWHEVQLAELATIKYGKNQKDVAIESSNIPIYGTGGIMGYASKALYDKPSVLIGRKGTIDRVRYVTKPFWAVDTTFYTIINENKILPRYFYYLLSLVDLSSYNEGTTIPSLRTETLNRLEFMVPPLDIQTKIAGVLGALDDKIELNNKINNNLEQQAQALFKSWFVDFEPFGGTMPDDWKTEKLDKCTSEVIRGFTSKYVKKSNLINLNQKVNKGKYLEKQYYKFLDETISVPQEKYAHKKDIILNSLGQGTLGRIHFWYETSTNVVVDQHITIIRAKKGVSTAEYLYLLLSSSKYSDYFESCITGTTGMLMLNISAVRNTDIMLPSIKIQEKFANTIESLYEKIEQNNQENTRLAQLRDTLLPKLMSGEIDVSNVDISALTSADKLSFNKD